MIVVGVNFAERSIHLEDISEKQVNHTIVYYDIIARKDNEHTPIIFIIGEPTSTVGGFLRRIITDFINSGKTKVTIRWEVVE